MAGSCCAPTESGNNSSQWRVALWIALALNAAMFVIEMYAGAAADSRALLADALDFFGDSANYAISLAVAGMALRWRSRAALLKGVSLAALGFFVLVAAVHGALAGSSPEPETMGIIGGLALATNMFVAVLLFRFRAGDANMRSVWICSRNDAIGNIAVVAAAVGVFGTGTAWPDLFVAAILAALGISGGYQIIRQSSAELAGERKAEAQEGCASGTSGSC